MKIIIPRIPRSATRSDLKRLVKIATRRRFRLAFINKPQLIGCDILKIRDAMGSVERHGVIEVVPDRAALSLAKSLHGSKLNGKRVGARPYHRRRPQKFGFDPALNRRRPQLKIEMELIPNIEGYVEFAKHVVV